MWGRENMAQNHFKSHKNFVSFISLVSCVWDGKGCKNYVYLIYSIDLKVIISKCILCFSLHNL